MAVAVAVALALPVGTSLVVAVRAALFAGVLAVAEAAWTAVVDAALVVAPAPSADEPPEHAGNSIAAPGAAKRRTSNDKRLARTSLVLMFMVGSYSGRLRPRNPDVSLTLPSSRSQTGRETSSGDGTPRTERCRDGAETARFVLE